MLELRRALVASALLAGGCIEYLEPGELGQLRYIGDARGVEDLRQFPPISDRRGNVYVMTGAPDVAQVVATVGYEGGGGWFGRCAIHENAMRGAHGWVGRSVDKAWFWSGDALAEVAGDTSDCRNVLNTDPSSSADLAFKGVVPWVKETPSRTTMVAMIQSPTDPVPFFVLVDLDLRRYTAINEFVPRGADAVTVLGVGADPSSDSGFMVVHYMQGADIRVEGRFLNDKADVTDIANINGLDLAEEDAIVSFLQINSAGWVAGLVDTGEVVVFNRNGGRIRSPAGLQPMGVHRWGDDVYIVGVGNGRPAIAELRNDGTIGAARRWEASEKAASALRRTLEIQDDRFTPIDTFSWQNPTQSFGPFPFLHPHSPHAFAIDSTLMRVAGPGFMTAGETFTPEAVGPVGISYP